MLRKAVLGIALVVPLTAMLAACDDGPAETAGEKLDNAAEAVGDAINPPGPGEKLGREVDDITGN